MNCRWQKWFDAVSPVHAYHKSGDLTPAAFSFTEFDTYESFAKAGCTCRHLEESFDQLVTHWLRLIIEKFNALN